MGFFARHCTEGSSQVQGIEFYHYYSKVAHAYSFRINIAIADMHRITARILDVSNELNNTNFPFMKESVSVHHPII